MAAAVEKRDQLQLDYEEQLKKLEASSQQLEDANLSLQTAGEELEEAQKELEDRSQELESTYQQLEEAQLAQESSRQELEKTSQELQDKKLELETHEADTQGLVEELYREAETLRAEIEFLATEKLELEQALEIEREKPQSAPSEDLAAKVRELEQQVTRLEDERSDLEIVNIDLLQQLSETESELERLKGP
jgi:chromosome segregation ATPase